MIVKLKIPSGSVGITSTLQTMKILTERCQVEPRVHSLAETLADPLDSRAEEIREFVDELHRRFTYAPDPIGEYVSMPFEPGRVTVDADDACVFVAALAVSVGIRCRFVAARYGRSWTCFLEYEEADGKWTLVDPLRQKTDRSPDELVKGPVIGV